jgi:hypothetical protein
MSLIRARLRLGKETPSTPCKVKLTLADKVTQQAITTKYYLQFTLARNGHESITFDDWYYPANLAVDVIIGYAALIGPVFPLAMAMYQQQHELWQELQSVQGVNTSTLCSVLSSMDNGTFTACDTLHIGLPQQLLYPEIRNKTAKQVNDIFAYKRVKHHTKFQITNDDAGLGVRVHPKAKVIPPSCVISIVQCLPPMPIDDFVRDAHDLFEDYSYQTDEHVLVPQDHSISFGMLVNDLLDSDGYNCKFRRIFGTDTLQLVSIKDIEPGTPLSVPYGVDWWVRWLVQYHLKMPLEQWNTLLANAVTIYPGIHLRVTTELSNKCEEAQAFYLNNIQLQTGDLNNPFSSVHTTADEDKYIPDPASIPDEILPGGESGSLMADYQTRRDKYLNGLEAQVDPQFMSDELMVFLRSEECMQVFVPKEWKGLVDPDTGEPIIHTIKWFEKPPIRKFPMIRVRPEISGKARKEADHLLYIMFWVHSDSPLASSMLIAPKATDPFIRIVTNYAWMKSYMMVPKYPLVHVKDSLQFMKRGDPTTGKPFSMFCDLDMLASFHQLKIDEESSDWLSVVTPWGQFRPRFLPEGIPPATALLQTAVDRVFREHKDRMLTIYDNLLLGGTSKDDMLVQFKKVITCCRKNNMLLKLTKCWLGAKSVKFFGFICDNEKYYLDRSRVESVQAIIFPGDCGRTRAAKVKYMQRYLGMGNFFSGFIPKYATETAMLTDMIHDKFDWTCTVDKDNPHRKAFERHKLLIAQSFELFHPDYSLEWTLRVDASQLGIGGVLFQTTADGKLQPLHMFSQKFSDAGSRWHVMHQEAFAIFRCIQVMDGMLRGKEFKLQTDHRNLVWMDKSKNDKIIRMVQFLQSFTFVVEHIPGRINLIADMLSRCFPEVLDNTHIILDIIDDEDNAINGFSPIYYDDVYLDDCTEQELHNINLVHGGAQGHPGWTRTWAKLNKFFPGHKYSVEDVRSYVEECIVCQKTRLRSDAATIIPIPKHLPVKHPRFMVALDGTKVLTSAMGNTYILVIYNIFTKHVVLHPMKDKSADACAAALYKYFATFGLSDIVHSDLGSDFTSTTVHQLLTDWLGVTQSFALVDNPQADGVEPIVKAVLRHLSALVADGWDRHSWDSDLFLSNCMLMLNNSIHTTSPITAIQATFGFADAKYFNFNKLPINCTAAYVKELGEQLAVMREISRKYQLEKKNIPLDLDFSQYNQFKVGDLVFRRINKDDKRDKLSAFNAGPFEVTKHAVGTNHVLVKNLVTDVVDIAIDLKDLQAFFGTKTEAITLARQDDQQTLLDTIVNHTGDYLNRDRMTFLLRWADGDEQWKKFSKDITSTIAFDTYCNNHSCVSMKLILKPAAAVIRLRREMNTSVIDAKYCDTKFYYNLRSFGGPWFDQHTLLPNTSTINYVLPAHLLQHDHKNRKTMHMVVDILDWNTTVDNFYLHYHCRQLVLRENDHLLTYEECVQWDLFSA